MIPVKFYLVVVVLAAIFLQQSEAAVALEILDEHPDHKGKCYKKEENKAYDVGSTWSVEGRCVKFSCGKSNDGKYVITSTGCGATAVPPSCKKVIDPNLPHPKCCPTVECP